VNNRAIFHSFINPDANPEDSHNSWLKEKQDDGWAYGTEKDTEKKLHPCFVPYEDLPEVQKAKDYLGTKLPIGQRNPQ
jgi:hypothetical protein